MLVINIKDNLQDQQIFKQVEIKKIKTNLVILKSIQGDQIYLQIVNCKLRINYLKNMN